MTRLGVRSSAHVTPDQLERSSSEKDLLQVLRHWSPLGKRLSDENLLLFDEDRLLEFRPVDRALEARLRDVSVETMLLRILREEPPLSPDISHGSISSIPGRVTALLEGYHLKPAMVAPLMLRALPDWLDRRLSERGVDDPVALGRALRNAFFIAELTWALGQESNVGGHRDVVAAAIEAAATIAGELLNIELDDPSQVFDVDLLLRMHLARMAWIQILLRFDEHGDLVADGGDHLNQRLRRLIGRGNEVRRGEVRGFCRLFMEDRVPLVAERLEELLALGTEDPERDAALVRRVEEEERHRLLDVAARLLLPRYLIDEAVGMLQYLGNRGGNASGDAPLGPVTRLRRWTSRRAVALIPPATAGILLIVIAAGFALLGLVERFAPTLASASWLEQAFTASVPGPAVRYGLLLLAVIWVLSSRSALRSRGRTASYQLLLRVPAATGFGLAILLALSFEWIGTQSGLGRIGPLAAIIAAGAYSRIEFINQGGGGRRRAPGERAPGRERPALDLTVLAAGISMLVATLVLEVVGRTVLTRVDNFTAMLADPLLYLETLAVLASISLALGTFLQAIWDEQPITAPLSYLRLRG
jgi:hypothetical protein